MKPFKGNMQKDVNNARGVRMSRQLVQNEKRIEEILKEFEPKRENLISILHRIQDSRESHSIPEEAVNEIAEYLNVTPSEVRGVISFYSMFSIGKRGKYIIRVCTSAPCFIMGSSAIVDSLEEILGIKVGETTGNQLFTLEGSSCLGICDGAPAMMINNEVYTNLTADRVREIIEGKS
jgi:NADH-quinone oxidoreductase E subunit